MPYGYVTPLGGFTVEVWFFHVALPTYTETMVSQNIQSPAAGAGLDQFKIQLASGTGKLGVVFEDVDNSYSWGYIDPAADGPYSHDSAWHHVAVRVSADANTFKIWLDGALWYSGAFTGNIDGIDSWLPGQLSLGGRYAPSVGLQGAELFNGGLAYFAAYNVPLTDAQILTHYGAGAGAAAFAGDTEVDRLKRIYSYAGVPINAQRFDPAVTTLQAVSVAGQNALDRVQTTALDASGVVFADGQSTMVYQNRRHRYNGRTLMTLAEISGSAPNAGMGFSTDDTKVYNDVRASRPGGGSARLRNRVSEAEYGRKIRPLVLAINSDDELRNSGSWLVERYGEDRVRVSGVSLSAESSSLIQSLVETVEPGDRLAFEGLPDNAPENAMTFIVEAISVTADFKDRTWSLGLELSPADLWDVMQLAVSTVGDGSRIAL